MENDQPHFTFIDLFAGIGGIRIAFERAGGKCVFSAEYDPFAQKTYQAYFGERPDFTDIIDTDPPGDITKLPADKVPDHDILTAGFPCQPFSLAGVSKKNALGRPHGFDDPTQGTLFFDIKRILEAKKPPAFLLENVKNLQSHDKGRTFKIIRETLVSLGYDIHYRVIDAAGWVPQHRERIYIVGFRRKSRGQEPDFDTQTFDELHDVKPPPEPKITLHDILEGEVPEKYTLGPGTWATLERHKKYHSERGNGFGYSRIKAPFEERITRTISARYHKDGAEILIDQGKKRPRRLTPLECSRLMGFPEDKQQFFRRDSDLEQPVSDTQAYRQFGNSVVVPVVTQVAKVMVKKMKIPINLSTESREKSKS